LATDDVVEATISHIGAHGDGVALYAGRRLYVPLTVPGDRVRVRPLQAHGGGDDAEVVEVLSPGADRATPPCRHFGRCGGCSLQHLADAAYGRWKLDRAVLTMVRAGFDAGVLAPLARTPAAARRRATFAAMRTASGEAAVCLGFNGRRSHEIVDLADCSVLDPRIVGILPAMRRLLASLLPPGRRTRATVTLVDGDLDVVIELAEPGLAERQMLAAFARDADISRLSWRPDGATDAELLAQRRPVGVSFGGVSVAIPPGGFLQASAEGETALCRAVCSAVAGLAPAGRRSTGTVADLFAGAGTFTFPLAAGGARVHAVDADGTLIQALATAARRVPGVSAEHRDLFVRPLLADELRRYDAVVFDPPRTGARAQAEQLAQSPVPLVVAVSCNPDTFVRDARILAAGGYRLEQVHPVDQFLWSPHLELAAVFRRA
jgi:23S rRNA (uracil1939-C5)-methyltransferase